MFQVPESTLRDRIRGNVEPMAKVGKEPLFNEREEKDFVDHLIYMANIGYGYTKSNIQTMAKEYALSLKKTLTTKLEGSNKLSNNWFYHFMNRWPQLKLVKPQKLSVHRAKSTSQEKIKKYFEELSKIMVANNLLDKPNRIFNIDETGITSDHAPPKIVCNKNTKAQAVTSPRSLTVTIIAAGNAIGNHIPPYFIFPGKRWMPAFLEGAPPGASGEMSESGWSNGAVFENYLTNHFARHAGITNDPDQDPTF